MSLFSKGRKGMSGIISIATLIIGGVIVADILTHPAGTQAASSGISNLWSTSIGGLLGNAPSGTAATSSTTTKK